MTKTWTPVAIFSILCSTLMAVNCLYHFTYYRFVEGKSLDQIPIQIFGVIVLKPESDPGFEKEKGPGRVSFLSVAGTQNQGLECDAERGGGASGVSGSVSHSGSGGGSNSGVMTSGSGSCSVSGSSSSNNTRERERERERLNERERERQREWERKSREYYS